MSMNLYAIRVPADRIGALRADPDQAADLAEAATMSALGGTAGRLGPGAASAAVAQAPLMAGRTLEEASAKIDELFDAQPVPPGVSAAEWEAQRRQVKQSVAALYQAAAQEQAGGANAASGQDPGAEDCAHGNVLDLHKSWHMLHYLLTGEVWEGAAPGNLLMTGEELGEDMGFGPPRLHTPDAAAAFAEFIRDLEASDLAGRLDPARLAALDVYGCDGAQEAEDLEDELEHYFPQLKSFVTKAATEGDGLLIWLS